MTCFYAPPSAWNGTTIELDGGEACHLHVLRLNIGAEIKIMDGQGQLAICRLADLAKHGARAEILESEKFPREESRAIIALALSKATRRGFFMEKAMELGCSAIWIWQGDNSQGRIPSNFAENARAQLVAGAKQCANPWLAEVRTFSGIREVAREALKADYRILPYEQQAGQPMLDYSMLGRQGETVYVIGPEGGFSGTELETLAGAGFVAVSLGKRVLRCETAAVLCLGLHYWAAQTNPK